MNAQRLAAMLVVVIFVATTVHAQDEKRFECMGIGGGGQMYGTGSSPHDALVMHMSCDMGTFYVTVDGGASWSMVDQLQMSGITSCRPAYHPTDPNVVYMPYYRSPAQQLRVSHDRGRTWQVMCEAVPWGNPAPGKGARDKYEVGVIALNIDPENPNVMFASTAVGLYRSSDGGKTFAKCDDVAGIAVWVHAPPKPKAGAGRLIAAATGGVCVSTDGGATWTKAGAGLPAADLYGFCAATDPNTGAATCYAVCGDKGVWVSRDGGDTFAKCEDGLPESMFRFASMASTDPATAYVSNMTGSWGVYKTTDAGRTWKQVFGPQIDGIRWGWLGLDWTKGFGGRANCITVNPKNADVVMFVNTGEFFLTRDGGKTWTEGCSKYFGPDDAHREANQRWGSVGLEVALPTNLIFDPFDKNRVYMTYGDICFLISSDRGKSWRRSVSGIPKGWTNHMGTLICDPARRGVLYACVRSRHGTATDLSETKYRGGVVMSADGGENWKVISEGLPSDTHYPITMALDPRSPAESRTLYVTFPAKGVYKSTDGGKTWQHKSKGLGRERNMNVTNIDVEPDGTVYCLVTGRSDGWNFDPYPPGGLWKSTDGAETWTEVTKSTTLTYPVNFTVDPRNTKRIFIGSTQAPRKEGAGLFVTEDGGVSWRQVLDRKALNRDEDLYPFVHSGDIVFHPTDPRYLYYATKTHGMQISRDGGKTWSRMKGIPRLAVGKVIFDPRDPGTIYVCSVGLWKGPAGGY